MALPLEESLRDYLRHRIVDARKRGDLVFRFESEDDTRLGKHIVHLGADVSSQVDEFEFAQRVFSFLAQEFPECRGVAAGHHESHKGRIGFFLGKLRPAHEKRSFFNNQWLAALAKHLHYLPKLEEIRLVMTEVGDSGVKELAEHVHNAPNLLLLDLALTNVGDDGLQSLTEAAPLLRNLTCLTVPPQSNLEECSARVSIT